MVQLLKSKKGYANPYTDEDGGAFPDFKACGTLFVIQ